MTSGRTMTNGFGTNPVTITPGATLTLMHRLPGTILPLLRWYSDRLVKSVRKSSQRAPVLRPELRESTK